MRKLFRQEAIDQKTFRLYGEVILAKSWSNLGIAVFFIVIIGTVFTFLFTNTFSHKETVNGVLTPKGGLATIAAPQSGTLLAIQVKEGQFVEAGTPLFSLSTGRITKDGEAQTAIGNSLNTRINSLNQELNQQARQSKNKILECSFARRIDPLRLTHLPLPGKCSHAVI